MLKLTGIIVTFLGLIPITPTYLWCLGHRINSISSDQRDVGLLFGICLCCIGLFTFYEALKK